MKKHIKEKWVKALKSGEYKQGTKALKNGTLFCCLGVLCDIHRKTMKKGYYKWEYDRYLGEIDFLPKEVINWAGLKRDDQVVTIKGRSLTERNDGYYCRTQSFKEIAKVIENNL